MRSKEHTNGRASSSGILRGSERCGSLHPPWRIDVEARIAVADNGHPMGTWGTALYSDDLAADLRDDLRDLIGDGLTIEAAVDQLVREYGTDEEQAGVFWLVVADTAWRLGRPHATVGEVVAYRLESGRWTAFRVIGHHADKGGRSAICEPLDWVGAAPPCAGDIERSRVLPASDAWHAPQFFFSERRVDPSRLVRTGIASKPEQTPEGYSTLVQPYVDRLLAELFGLA